jgi:hypothetical protein
LKSFTIDNASIPRLATFLLFNLKKIIGTLSNKIPPSPLDFSVYFFGSRSVFGVKSTSTWTAKPEIIAQVPNINKEEWRFELSREACFSFSDAVNRLFKEFENNLERIASYCLENKLKVSVHIQLYGHKSDFILGFDKSETISKLSRVNAEFYISAERLED